MIFLNFWAYNNAGLQWRQQKNWLPLRRSRPRLTVVGILRLIRIKTVIYKNTVERLFRIVLRKQPFRMRSVENLF